MQIIGQRCSTPLSPPSEFLLQGTLQSVRFQVGSDFDAHSTGCPLKLAHKSNLVFKKCGIKITEVIDLFITIGYNINING